MQDLKTYLSTAPVLAILCVSFLAALLIEINRFFPDALFLSLSFS
uniref:Photosystem I reaction center subunit IX n=12 Tax=Pinus subgen. Pinus TaxID=139271 RepID=PSAJ_PINTH|nr:photosystem I subunit IX [Pinus thunbergii]YP_009154132.1 PSI J protein [Pinus taiwanensis]YP_009183506.1 photosystem I subunit IX [Pinus tabuliformis]YP_009672889.1 photosystem I subunit IX [Pinus yunnanensis]YP_010339013.1 photosystem I subunit IX [Pinus tabuliformis var. henryi]P41613.1 RecName: Full=Photosystem I reaction center subunit IX; AltName: Full=PSI-J [Pinus thunbergii]AET47888.1 photosystem I subunit IX [Pinus kesiya]AET48104.1 photosystem I subunit IX [Pinus hwangshanensis]